MPAVLIGVAAVAGVILRVWLYRSSLGTPNSDEAVVGLMALHARHGEFTTFLWGQDYGGAQEALLAVPVFALFGASWLSLRMVPIILTAVTAVVVWRVGRRTIGGRAAIAAGALFWVWPPFLLSHLDHAYGFYASGNLYCALILLLGLRVVESPAVRRVGLFGLVLGLAFWQTSQIVPVAVPFVVWMIWRCRRALRHLWIGLGGALVGASPWLLYNARHGWSSLTLPAGDTGYLDRLRLFVSPLLPMMLGLRSSLSAELLLPHGLTYLVYGTLLVLFVVGAVKARKRDTAVLYVVAAVFPFVYAVNAMTAATSEPRYLLIVGPVYVLIVAQLARTYPHALALLAVAFAVSFVSLDRMANVHIVQPGQPPPPPRDFRPLIAVLDRLGLDRIYADYWIAYRVDFETEERIIAANNRLKKATLSDGQVTPKPDFGRYPPYAREVRRGRPGFVFLRETAATKSIVRLLRRHRYLRYDVGRFVVFAPPAQKS